MGGGRTGAGLGMTAIAPRTRAAARRLRADMTPQERKLWQRFRDLNRTLGTHLRRQAPIGRHVADFADLGRRLVIEVDGGQHGGGDDATRDAWLSAQGFAVLRFWNHDVAEDIEGVMRAVLDALEVAPPPEPAPSLEPAPPPHPSPTRWEEGARPDGRRIGAGLAGSPPPGGEGMGAGGRPAGTVGGDPSGKLPS